MKTLHSLIGLLIGVILLSSSVDAKDDQSIIKRYQPPSTDVYNIAQFNRVHRTNNLWTNITNWGVYGNWPEGNSNAMEDPEYPGTWAPQCEFPGESYVQYLFMGGLWIGALIEDGGFYSPRVSTGFEGWTGPVYNQWELQPGEIGGSPQEEHGILERSNIPGAWNRLGEFIYSPEAIAPQEFIAVYTDTLTEAFWVGPDIVDGPHEPLGLRISQWSLVWDDLDYDDLVIIEYTIENIGQNFLQNIYLGLYMDCDVGLIGESARSDDDICGFLPYAYLEPSDSLEINCAYIADNDGRPSSVGSGQILPVRISPEFWDFLHCRILCLRVSTGGFQTGIPI